MTDKDLANIRAFLQRDKGQRRRDATTGKELASSALRKLRVTQKKQFPTDRMATVLSAMLSNIELAERDPDCFDLLLSWTFERYWGVVVEKHIAIFQEAYDALKHLGHGPKNPLVWGDIDCGAWIEPHPKKQIIVSEIYCAARDDNTYLYMLEKNVLGYRFQGRTVWPRTKRVLPGTAWDYVDRASLHLYRKLGFEPNYNDCRDVGYCFSMDNHFDRPKVENAYHQPSAIKWALRHLCNLREVATEIATAKTNGDERHD